MLVTDFMLSVYKVYPKVPDGSQYCLLTLLDEHLMKDENNEVFEIQRL